MRVYQTFAAKDVGHFCFVQSLGCNKVRKNTQAKILMKAFGSKSVPQYRK